MIPSYSHAFQIFYWIGWKPDPKKQPKPLEPHRDSDFSLKDIDKLDEILKKVDEDGKPIDGDGKK